MEPALAVVDSWGGRRYFRKLVRSLIDEQRQRQPGSLRLVVT